MIQTLAVLIVEDSESDAQLIVRFLTKAGYTITFKQVETATQMRAALEKQPWEIVISDYRLPEFGGHAALMLLQETGLDIPFIVVSGTMGEETAVDMMKAGAHDYVMKGNLARLAPAVERELDQAELRRERKRAEEALRESEEKYRLLVDTASETIIVAQDNMLKFVNRMASDLIGFSEQELTSRPFPEFVHPDDQGMVVESYQRRIKGGVVQPKYAFRLMAHDGSTKWVEISAVLIDWKGRPATLNFLNDITNRKQAEEALAASEAELRALFAGMTDVVIVYDAEGRYIKIAPTNPANLYRPTDNMLGKTVHDILPNEQADYIVSKIRAALQSGEVVNGEYLLQIGGKDIWFTYNASRLSENTVVWVAHDITNRKQAEEDVRMRLNELEMLYATSIAIGQSLQPQEIGQKIIDILSEKLQWQHATICQYHPESETIELLAFHRPGLENEAQRLAAEEQIRTLIKRPGQGFAGWVIQHGQPIYCGDVTKDRRYIEVWSEIRSCMHVPLKVGERMIGCLSVESEQDNAFTETDEWLITTLAAQAASALENANLFAETQQRLAESEAVTRISIALRTSESLDNMLPAFLDETLKLLVTQTGSIWLYEPESEELRLTVSRGWFNQLSKTAVKPGEGLVGTTFATGKVHLTPEFIRDPAGLDANFGQVPAGWGGMCVPIESAQAVEGVMVIFVQLPRELTSGENRVLGTLAEIVGIAIQRMRSREQTEQQLQHVQALHEIDTSIAASLDLSLTLEIFLKNVLAQLHVDAASILLLNPHTQMLDYTAGRGFRNPGSEPLHLGLRDSTAGRVVSERRSIHSVDLPADNPSPAYKKLIDNEGFVSYYGVPLLIKGGVLGVLEIFHRSQLKTNAGWLDFLLTLAGQVTIAIDSSLTYDNLQRSNLELVVTYDKTLEGWSRALDMRDKETEGHSQRVTEMTLQLANILTVRDEEMEHIRRGALLHDLGKIAIPDSILLKPGPLTAEEWEVMRTHPTRAYEMLSPIPYLQLALDIPYCHHEKWDGAGYPRGLKGEEIALAARIFAIIDVYDALISDRPYRPAWEKGRALEHIREQCGKHFDPKVVEAFIRLLPTLK